MVSLYAVVTDAQIYVLDVAAKLDAKATPLCKEKWGQMQFAPSLSRELYPEVCATTCM